ncbi:MAG: hypothetical protein KGD64_06230 [Candidatus Heimdallarchaeota archaeon]|nr:hypothetical protein [Candidatus Heimdallarchaeota archaeon]
MESSTSKSVSVKAKVIKPDAIEMPSFEFEDLIIEHYKKYPRTAAMIENPLYLKALESPFFYFYLVPIALFKVKLNSILALKWWNYIKLWFYVVLLFIPTIVMVIVPFQNIANQSNLTTIMMDLSFSVIIPIIVAVLFSLFYLKYTHDGYLGLTLEKRVEWIEKPVREYYAKYYDRYLPKNPLIILLSLLSGIGINLPMLLKTIPTVTDSTAFSVANTFGIISCMISPLFFYIFYLATYYLILNTSIYSKILKTLKLRLTTYLDEYGTLLNRENYDIIWALGDTPGRSIRQLENIPVAGLLSALITTIAMAMGTINILIYGIASEMPQLGFPILNFIDADSPWTVMVVIISVLIAAIMFLIVFMPLNSFRIKMVKFKMKALIELDNYIFANVVEFELKYADDAKQENVTMFQLRQYISSMRTVPISTGKLLKSSMAIIVWVLNMRRIFTTVAGDGL